MRTEDLIVELARSAGPVRPLAPPMQRFARWAVLSAIAVAAGVAVIGMRPDVASAAQRPAYLVLAAVSLLTALVSASTALVLSVPGAERSPVQRWFPIATAALWGALLTMSLRSGGDAGGRVAAFPFHAGCVAQIFVLSLLPGWTLYAMVRRAAPLRRYWNAGLAALAALAFAAVGTQFLCPIDDPAHQLVGHLFPVIGLALLGAAIGSRALVWPPKSATKTPQG